MDSNKALNENAKLAAIFLYEMYCGGGWATSRLDYATMLKMHLRLIQDSIKTDFDYETCLASVNASRKRCIDTLIDTIDELVTHGN